MQSRIIERATLSGENSRDGSREKFLKPLTGKKRDPHFATFDVEANNWIELEMLGFYDGSDYWQFSTVKEFLDHVLRKKYRGFWIYAHFGGKYDFQFLMEELQGRNIVFSCIMQGPKIIALKIKVNSRNNITFVDSSPLLCPSPPQSLDKLCKTFRVETPKLTGAIDFSKERVDKENPLHQQYLKQDCIALYQILQAFRRDPKIAQAGLKITLASTAMDLWKRTLKYPIKITSNGVQEFVRKSYFGGRCEIFKTHGDALRCYDVNSLFPYSLRHNPLPVEYRGETRDIGSFGFHDVSVSVPDCYCPILPYKQGTKLLFPVGTFRGVYFSEELKLAIGQGVKILNHHRGVSFSQSSDLFTEYVDYFYAQRQKYEPGTAGNYIAKTLLNSLYGKFGQREETQLLKIRDTESAYRPFHTQEMFEKTGLIIIDQWRRSSHMLCHISAATTSWARIHMAKNYYLPNQNSIYYTDTDSIHTDRILPYSLNLGDIKLENAGDPEKEVFSAYYRQPKGYFLYTNSGIITKKLKGFPSNFLKNIDLNTFKNKPLEYVENKFATLKKSLISNKKFLSMITVKKSIRSAYDKRRVLSNGDTVPWKIEQGEIKNG